MAGRNRPSAPMLANHLASGKSLFLHTMGSRFMAQASEASQQARPLQIGDITVIDNTKLKKAVTAAALGNAMEWFDFGVYGFVAFALGKVFFPDASPTVQIVAALGTDRKRTRLNSS